jgi:PD-(D/E)XK nuclease superfamily
LVRVQVAGANQGIGERMDIIPGSKANIVLDASKIDLFETCPQRYHYRYNLNKVLPILQKAKALDLGALAHSGLEVYFKMLKEGKHYNDRMHATLMKIREKAANAMESNSSPEDAEAVLQAVEGSCDYWRAEDENSIEVLGVEEPFLYILFEDDNVRILISGKIDLLCNYRPVGRGANYEGLPMDHKTFSRDSMILRKSNQFENYCYAVNSVFIVINRIGLHDPNVKNPKTAEDKFKRHPLSYDPIYLKRWKDNLTRMILNEYLNCVAEDSWPEKPTSCNKFNRLCEYYAVCDASSDEDKERKIETEYVDGEVWDVTKEMNKE